MITSESTVQSGNLQFLRRFFRPLFGFAQRILVSDHQGRFHLVAETSDAMLGIAAKYKSNVALCEIYRNIRNGRFALG
jgi:hypothetical protein